MVQYDELLGWRHVPNTQAHSESKEYKVTYRINSKGLRDKERSYDKQKGEFRVLCLGDSLTYGWGVNSEERFTDLLEGYFTNVSFINTGVQGYGLDQELLYFMQEGKKYNADLILMYVIPDDSVRACYSKMWDRPKPQFLLDDKNRLVLSNVPVPRIDVFSFGSHSLDKARYYLSQKSYLFWFIQNKFLMWRDVHFEPTGNERIKLKLAEAILKRIEETAAAVGAPVVIVGDLMYDKTIPIRETGIYFCPDPLEPYKGNISEVCHNEFGHPNVRGHKIIADTIYRFLTEKRLVPQEHWKESGELPGA